MTTNRDRQAFRLKGTMPALSLLCLQTEDLEAIEKQLVDHLSQMPQFFMHAPIMLDLEALPAESSHVDLTKLGEILRKHHLVPVAVRNPSEAQKEEAVRGGWGVLQNELASTRPGARAPAASAAAASAVDAPRAHRPSQVATPLAPVVRDRALAELAQRRAATAEPEPEPQPGSLTVTAPVRSGQVVYAVGTDLVVLAPVSSGAELIADGNIHVYGPLRGRALAGASGNGEVSIFCMGLEAEFLSIAGRYLMAEEIDKARRGKPTRAHLKDDQLVLAAL
jgi:septum site-determining protein MinC